MPTERVSDERLAAMIDLACRASLEEEHSVATELQSLRATLRGVEAMAKCTDTMSENENPYASPLSRQERRPLNPVIVTHCAGMLSVAAECAVFPFTLDLWLPCAVFLPILVGLGSFLFLLTLLNPLARKAAP